LVQLFWEKEKKYLPNPNSNEREKKKESMGLFTALDKDLRGN